MKNIHLLPTEKPSRLMIDTIENKLYLQPILHEKTINVLTQNIYITSDEYIKDVRPHNGKWQLEKGQILNKFPDYLTDLSECKLVILTTDKDLIKDGVQAIDDEFLEWFIKNPSCEEVKIESWQTKGEWELDYKLIIPQEEPKQESYICPHTKIQCDDECCVSAEDCHITSFLDSGIVEPKQETLEEAAANLADPNLCKTDNWIAGAKWQSERMYSEEEVLKILHNYRNNFELYRNIQVLPNMFFEWFEQNKKK
jgi:hypothetical protein